MDEEKEVTKVQDFVCIQVRSKKWSGKTGLEAEDLGLDPENVPNIFKLGNKRLCPKEELEPFDTLFNSTRNWLNSISLPFILKQVRIVPKMKIPEIVAKLKEARNQVGDLAAEFAKKFPVIKEEWLQEHHNIRNTLEEFYPSATEIEGKFDLDWTIFKVMGISAKEVDDQAMIEAMQDAQAEFKNQCNDMVTDSIQIVRGKVSETVAALSKKIRDGKIVRNDSLKSVANIFDWFNELNVFGDADVGKSLGKLKGFLDGVADAAFLKDNDKLNTDILKLADEVIEKAGNIQDLDDVSKAYKRQIDLGD